MKGNKKIDFRQEDRDRIIFNARLNSFNASVLLIVLVLLVTIIEKTTLGS